MAQASQALALELPGPVELLLAPVRVALLPVRVAQLPALVPLPVRAPEDVSVLVLPSAPAPVRGPGLQPLAPPPWGPRLCART